MDKQGSKYHRASSGGTRDTDIFLRVEQLSKSYSHLEHEVHALRDVSFSIHRGESLGVVGESGSGKSTLGRILLALETPDQGEVIVDGLSLFRLRGKDLQQMRKQVQVIFQNPTASLHPRLTVGTSVIEALENFPEVVPPFLADIRHSKREMAARLLEMVELSPELMDRYPHQLSGGQKQRVAIARGISLVPRLLICDEPTSSLDLSIQLQMLRLLKKLQTQLGMAMLFISHDMAAVAYMCERVMVMKSGQIVDHCLRSELLHQGRHLYTKQLVEAASII